MWKIIIFGLNTLFLEVLSYPPLVIEIMVHHISYSKKVLLGNCAHLIENSITYVNKLFKLYAIKLSTVKQLIKTNFECYIRFSRN